MIIIRPIQHKDLDALEKFAFTGLPSLPTLPKNRQMLEQKIKDSIESFKKKITVPDHEMYTFVLEDLATGEIGGTCAIRSRIGVSAPVYFYRIETITSEYKDLPVTKEMRVLKPVDYTKGPSEICALYLAPEYRKEGLGRLLSLSRFLFISSHHDRFEENMIAQMLGVIDKNNISPFWLGLGRCFLDIKYSEAIAFLQKSREFIPAILPKWPVYISLLTQDTQEVIGKVCQDTKPALNMLTSEGFQFAKEIDVFDAGPKLEAKTRKIRMVKRSRKAIIDSITSETFESEQLILSNTSLDFRACYGKIKILTDENVAVSSEVAEALNLKLGSEICYASPYVN